METTVCPRRLLDEDKSGAVDVVEWWLTAARRDPWGGSPGLPEEWPEPGGILNQQARVADAVSLLLAEWQYLPERKARRERQTDEGDGGKARKRKAADEEDEG